MKNKNYFKQIKIFLDKEKPPEDNTECEHKDYKIYPDGGKICLSCCCHLGFGFVDDFVEVNKKKSFHDKIKFMEKILNDAMGSSIINEDNNKELIKNINNYLKDKKNKIISKLQFKKFCAKLKIKNIAEYYLEYSNIEKYKISLNDKNFILEKTKIFLKKRISKHFSHRSLIFAIFLYHKKIRLESLVIMTTEQTKDKWIEIYKKSMII